MAHTPGPWWVDPDYYGDVQCAKGEIASAFRWWNNGAKWEIRGAFATNDECRANALLIAAAPDLLAALTSIRGWMIPGMDWTDEIGAALKAAADDAIAKAKGR